ncbi:hypothetical protein QQS21_010575 [Conoideocrella luteorostrata]|uniref:Peroxidase n=1 Tax=Conoideocrella luteorostrata TaxID=1105319 RepID=A0AAJ0CEW3_9HYPO|nr:hypothetical protein QQS21_010575 [Conoideocrella luteorostrata]
MKATISLLAAIPMAYAFPGMSGLMSELGKRQSDNSNLLIGDLVDRPIVDLSETGNTIRNILQGTEDPQDHSNSYSCPPAMDTRECAEDTCCIWKHIAIEMQSKMSEHGQCNDFARQAIRMGFHDAAAWSLGTGKDGGADGSLILARECYTRGDNTALRSGCDQVQEWYDRYKSHGVSMADLIQMAGKSKKNMAPDQD